MIRGVDVVVKSPEMAQTQDVPPVPETDRFGNAVYTFSEGTTVHGVLVSPGATDDLEASRPEGAEVAYTLHFPKAFSDSLEGCIVTLPAPWAGDYRVIGDPHPYMAANTPTPWHMAVEVEAVYG